MTKRRILIVEDEAITAFDLQLLLEGLNYEVCGKADSGKSAIDEVEKESPDLVMMDIVLRGNMNGIETAKKIWHDYKIPIVFLTAYSDEATVVNAESADPFGYILKPIDRNEIRASLKLAFYKYDSLTRLLETNRRIMLIHEFSRKFSRCREVDQVIEVICDAAVEIFQPKYYLFQTSKKLDRTSCGIIDEVSLDFFKEFFNSNSGWLQGYGQAEAKSCTLNTEYDDYVDEIFDFSYDKKEYSVLRLRVKNLGLFVMANICQKLYDREDLNQLKLMLDYAEESHNRVTLEKELNHKAIHDPLTGLYNRHYLGTTIIREVNQAKRYQHPIGFILLDVNNLKHINDIHGHKTGDQLLVEVAQLMVGQVRKVDTVVRYGGDEFLVMLPETGEMVNVLRDRMIASKDEWNENHQHLGYSIDFAIGISYWINDGKEAIEDAIDRADKDMYEKKLEMKIKLSESFC